MQMVQKLITAGMALLLATGCAAAQTRTILILDATAQMSAKFGHLRKIDAVKSAVTAAVSRMDPKAPLALWAFGTDPVKKCGGKGELVRLQPAGSAAAAIARALATVQPKAARAPIFATLQSALESGAEPKDAAITAVIIAGTGDDCSGDICSEAKRLHTSFPNAKLSVLGIGMSEQAAANFTCAAKAMDGGFTAVKSGTDLTACFARPSISPPQRNPLWFPPLRRQRPGHRRRLKHGQRLKHKHRQRRKHPQPRPQEFPNTSRPPQPRRRPPKRSPPSSQRPDPEPNMVLAAVLAKGQPPLDAGVTWEIYKVITTPAGQLRQAESPSWTRAAASPLSSFPRDATLQK